MEKMVVSRNTLKLLAIIIVYLVDSAFVFSQQKQQEDNDGNENVTFLADSDADLLTSTETIVNGVGLHWWYDLEFFRIII
jgi:peroxiredoxin